MAPSDFGDPNASIDPRSLRVSATGLAVAFETSEHEQIAVLPLPGQTPEQYIVARLRTERRRSAFARTAIALGAAFVVAVVLAASVFGPGSVAHPFALAGVGALAISTGLLVRACTREPVPGFEAVIPRDLIDTLTERDAERIRVAAREGRQDDAVAELVRRRIFGLGSGDLTTALPVIAA